MKQRTLILSDAERAQLGHTRNHDRRPYLREKAAALLKITDGQPPYQVARNGLVKPRHPETVYGWLNDFEQCRQPCPQPARRRRRAFPLKTKAWVSRRTGSGKRYGKCCDKVRKPGAWWGVAAGRFGFYESAAPG